MPLRDRVKELRRVPASHLRRNPKNWRKHPQPQQGALRAVLNEVGFAGAVLARELCDGSLEIVDGHLRADTLPDQLVPVLVLDVSAAEADKLLATHDVITSLAEPDWALLAELREQLSFQSPALTDMLAQFQLPAVQPPPAKTAANMLSTLAESYRVVAQCASETQQRELYERLTAEGFRCRVLLM